MANELPYNFGGLPVKYSTYKNSKIIVLPVPFDKTSSWMKGSDKGPDAIINASRNMELYDIETNAEVYRKGIHTAKAVTAGNARTMAVKVQNSADDFLKTINSLLWWEESILSPWELLKPMQSFSAILPSFILMPIPT